MNYILTIGQRRYIPLWNLLKLEKCLVFCKIWGITAVNLRIFIEKLIIYIEAVASDIFKQILSGINYLHTNGVCHRDLKPNNILVSNGKTTILTNIHTNVVDGKIVKITDFNVSKFTEDKKKYSSLSTENCKMWTHTGTIAFTAPEVFTETEYT